MQKRNISFALTFVTCFILWGITTNAQRQPADTAGLTGGTLICSDDFSTKLDPTRWIVEMDPAPNSSVYTNNNKLALNTKGGVTVWLNKPLEKNIRIEYDRTVIVAGGVNDRLSDCNQFWMARDPRNTNLFTRRGVLESYDSLQLYYVGMGGNSNRTSRFRKYEGNGERRLIREYTDTAHLLQANKVYHITIIVNNGATSYWVNGQCHFYFKDPALLQQGYFGFRSTKSHQEISKFKVFEL